MFQPLISSAWLIDQKDFKRCNTLPERLAFFLQYALLAPSGHNAQPWRFTVEGNQINFFAVPERSLACSDPERRQLYLSFGCAVENVIIAADFFGYDATVSIPDSSALGLATVTVRERGDRQTISYDEHLISAIPKRYSNRFAYQKKSIPEKIIIEMKDVADRLGPGYTLKNIDREADLNLLAKHIIEASVKAMERDSFRAELSEFLISNISKKSCGMPGFALGIPLVPSLFIKELVKKINVSKLSRKKDYDILAKHTPTVMLICAPRDSRLDWLTSGRIAERCLLQAAQNGLVTAIHAAPVQDVEFARKIEEDFNLPGRLQFIFRLGFPTTKPFHTPRFALNECLTTTTYAS